MQVAVVLCKGDTSFATPRVCGIVALLLGIFPGLTAVEAKSALTTFSE